MLSARLEFNDLLITRVYLHTHPYQEDGGGWRKKNLLDTAGTQESTLPFLLFQTLSNSRRLIRAVLLIIDHGAFLCITRASWQRHGEWADSSPAGNAPARNWCVVSSPVPLQVAACSPAVTRNILVNAQQATKVISYSEHAGYSWCINTLSFNKNFTRKTCIYKSGHIVACLYLIVLLA